MCRRQRADLPVASGFVASGGKWAVGVGAERGASPLRSKAPPSTWRARVARRLEFENSGF